MPHPVEDTVRQRGVGEAAVASGRPVRHTTRLDEHDPATRIALLGLECGPKPGEASTDDGELGFLVAREGRAGSRAVWLIQPEAGRACLRES